MAPRKAYTPTKRAVADGATVSEIVRHLRERDRDHIAIAEVFASFESSMRDIEQVSDTSYHRVQIQAGRVVIKPAGPIVRFSVDSAGRLAIGFSVDAVRGVFAQCLSTKQRHNYYPTVLTARSLTLEARTNTDIFVTLATGAHLFNVQIVRYQ